MSAKEKDERYRDFRRRMLHILQEAKPCMQHAAQLCGGNRDAALARAQDMLERENFSLVLAGAFQSGKSTLFDYLCDGRELSPVGPGGGGIRTSGCRVSAHPLPEGAKEYAEVSWVSGQDFLHSLGDALRQFFPDLPEEFVDLDNRQQCQGCAEYVWRDFIQAPDVDDGVRELVRCGLLFWAFYDDYKGRFGTGRKRMGIGEAVGCSTYPQDWERKWGEVDSLGAIHSVFNCDEVAFIFCGGVDFYLDSPNLRSIGCSLTDCPGLSVSVWDTELARKSIRESDAVLYLFNGARGLSEADIDNLNECLKIRDGQKLLFAANLTDSREKWERIERQSVVPKLKDMGFEKPVIDAIHAGIALRGHEMQLLEAGRLSPSSRQAIGLELRDSRHKKDTDENVRWFLRKQLGKYINNLTDFNHELEDCQNDDNSLDIGALENLHGGLVLLRRIHSFVERHKFEFRLSQVAEDLENELRNAKACVNTHCTALNGDIEKVEQEVQRLEARLNLIKDSKDSAIGNIGNAIQAQGDKIFSRFLKILNRRYTQEARPRIEAALAGVLADVPLGSLFAFVWWSREDREHEFYNKFEGICKDLFYSFHSSLCSEMASTPEYWEIINAFDAEQRNFAEKTGENVEKIKLSENRVHILDRWIDKAISKMYPGMHVVIQEINNSVWDPSSNSTLAGNFVGRYNESFKTGFREALTEAFYGKGAKIQYFWDKRGEFEYVCSELVEKYKKQLQKAKRAMSGGNMKDKRAKIDEAQTRMEELAALCCSLDSIRKEIMAHNRS